MKEPFFWVVWFLIQKQFKVIKCYIASSSLSSSLSRLTTFSTRERVASWLAILFILQVRNISFDLHWSWSTCLFWGIPVFSWFLPRLLWAGWSVLLLPHLFLFGHAATPHRVRSAGCSFGRKCLLRARFCPFWLFEWLVGVLGWQFAAWFRIFRSWSWTQPFGRWLLGSWSPASIRVGLRSHWFWLCETKELNGEIMEEHVALGHFKIRQSIIQPPWMELKGRLSTSLIFSNWDLAFLSMSTSFNSKSVSSFCLSSASSSTTFFKSFNCPFEIKPNSVDNWNPVQRLRSESPDEIAGCTQLKCQNNHFPNSWAIQRGLDLYRVGQVGQSLFRLAFLGFQLFVQLVHSLFQSFEHHGVLSFDVFLDIRQSVIQLVQTSPKVFSPSSQSHSQLPTSGWAHLLVLPCSSVNPSSNVVWLRLVFCFYKSRV